MFAGAATKAAVTDKGAHARAEAAAEATAEATAKADGQAGAAKSPLCTRRISCRVLPCVAPATFGFLLGSPGAAIPEVLSLTNM